MYGNLVSVIVPIYNVEKYLEKCIESIVNQTYKNLEIILVDDGSPDNCPAICDEWAQKDSRIKVIHKKNGGLSSARNAGLEVSNGEYISFVDSDDWLDENTFEELLENNDEQADFISFGLLEEFDTETHQKLRADTVLYNQNEIFSNILNDNGIAGYACNKLFKRSIIGDDRFDETLMSCEDIDFCVRIAMKCRYVLHTDSKFYHYRQRKDSMTGDFSYSSRKLSVIKAYENIMPIYAEYAPQYSYIVERNYLKQNLNVKGRMILSKKKDSSILKMLNTNIKNYYGRVVRNRNNSLSLRMNIVATRIFPSLLLRIKQQIIFKRRGLNND